jgi:3-oxoacyl-[acyl-carrier protein] reductase
MNLDFKNRNILVTGGTRGIGKEVAISLHSMGGNIIIAGTKDPLFDWCRFIKCDFSTRNGVDIFIKELDSLGNIDACFNCAGINRISDIENINIDDFDSVINVNLYAPFLISRHLIPRMKINNYGRIVNVSSIWGTITKKGRTSYSISKNGIIGLTRSLAVECSENNITVNCISPGFTETELTKSSLSDLEISKIEKNIPVGRMAKPIEISNVAVFLLSECNSYMTGQNIIVDGGYSII